MVASIIIIIALGAAAVYLGRRVEELKGLLQRRLEPGKVVETLTALAHDKNNPLHEDLFQETSEAELKTFRKVLSGIRIDSPEKERLFVGLYERKFPLKGGRFLPAAAAALCLTGLLPSCINAGTEREQAGAYRKAEAPVLPGGVRLVKVEASTFTLNRAFTGRQIEGAMTIPKQCLQESFWISEGPVTTGFLEAYGWKGRKTRNGLSYDDIRQVLGRAAAATGLPLTLPTEAMYEAAVEAGAINPHKRDECVLADGWKEWIDDGNDVEVNLSVPAEGDNIVLRALYWRAPIERFRRRTDNRFYIAMRTDEGIPEALLAQVDHALPADTEKETSDGKRETFHVNGVKLEMLPVAGGSLELGATAEQLRYAEDDENPVRTVSLPSFKMSKTEVTLALWQAVMETTPFGNDPSYPGRAVINVSWYDAEAFVVRLRELTGRPFRLPSEDEWEYAARGGQKSGGYVFAGGNNAKDYVVCTGKAAWGKNKGENVRPQLVNVASKKPNELGLYDMSGNAWEWVRGASPGGLAILRGGSRLSTNIACRVSNRQAMDPLEKKDTFGFRIAL